jgi:hypothetical protein
VQRYCSGSQELERERERERDSNISVETYTTTDFCVGRGRNGYYYYYSILQDSQLCFSFLIATVNFVFVYMVWYEYMSICVVFN